MSRAKHLVDVSRQKNLVDSDGIVVGNASSESECCSVSATDLCPHLDFFCSEGHLNQWNAKHPEQPAKLHSLEEAIKWGQTSFEGLMSGENACCG